MPAPKRRTRPDRPAGRPAAEPPRVPAPRRGPPDPGPEARRLEAIVGRFRALRVVVLGDLVADEFVYGDIARISREAPVPILTHRRTVVVPGGGANAVANLRALGATPLPVGLVGRDEAGRRMLAALRAMGIDRSGILVLSGYETPCKSRILAGGVHTRRQQIVRLDRGGKTDVLPAPFRAGLRRALRTALRRATGMLVSDYGYGAATPERVGEVAAELRRRRLPLLVDSRARVAAYRGATACTPNQEELELALDLAPLESDRAVESAGRRLRRRTGGRAVLVTRGARGMCLVERGKAPEHVPAFGSDEVADVTGAGDTVIAAFTLALIAGASCRDAALLANYAAGLVVMKAGTATVSPEEVLGAIREDLAP
jgi:rfaE bifunctional protein kinase chain/domain